MNKDNERWMKLKKEKKIRWSKYKDKRNIYKVNKDDKGEWCKKKKRNYEMNRK